MSAQATNPALSTEHLTTGQRRTAKASYVRLKHGLYSDRAVIPGESEEAFQAFRHDMVVELLPGTPIESAYVEQMVMLQWKLRRLWAGQTGVHRRHELEHPDTPDGAASFPERVAACIHADNAGTGDLHRLSLEEQRLINLFIKVHRKYEQNVETRRQRLMRGAARNVLETKGYSPTAEGQLDFRVTGPRLDAGGDPNACDERLSTPPPIALEALVAVPEAPAAVPETPATVPAPRVAASAATASNDESGEITDRQTSLPAPATCAGDANATLHLVSGNPAPQLQGEVAPPLSGAGSPLTAVSASNDWPSREITDRRAARSRRRPVSERLDPAHMTPYQRELEAQAAETGHWRNLIDRKAAAG